MNRNTGYVIASILVAGLSTGCQKSETASTATTQTSSADSVSTDSGAVTNGSALSPEELGELGARIERSPSDVEKLLAEKGLNQQSFERAVRKVAENPEESKRYAAAYEKARS